MIWYYYLFVKFVMWIVKQKIENKRNLFKKATSDTARKFCNISPRKMNGKEQSKSLV